MDRLYTRIVKAVERYRANKVVEIEADEILDEINSFVDAKDYSKEFLLNFYIRSLLTSALNQKHCYTMRRGSGRYINVDACMDIDVISRLMANAKYDIKSDNARHTILAKRWEQLHKEQYVMNIDDPGAPLQTVGDVLEAAM